VSDEFNRALSEFLDAEDKWLAVESRWFDDHKPVRNARIEKQVDAIYRNVKFRVSELRTIANKLGGEYVRTAEYALGKNFGLPR
jgi:hypothetical protein